LPLKTKEVIMKRKNQYPVMSFILLAAFIVIFSCTKDNNNGDDPNKYSIGGTVEGLVGSGLVVQNNNSDDLSISDNGAFTFPARLEDSTTYNVTIETFPVGQTCYVENGSGMVDGENVTNVKLICETPDIVGDCSTGSITYSHNLSNDYGGFHEGIIVTGTVNFTCDEQGKLSGSGTLLITVEGTITEPCSLIEYEGVADLNVTLTGQYSVAQVVFNITETWYVGSPMASGSLTDLCGDNDGPFAYPLIENTIQYTLPFPTIDEYTVTQPYGGASGTGSYNWTLHII
jgi:hypothetical protein